MKDNPTETAFWALLRMGLWQRQEPVPQLSAQDWQEVARLSRSSGTTGLVAEGIEQLPPGQRPPLAVLQEFVTFRGRLIRRHQRHNTAIAHLMELFAGLGVESWLLKGQGNALQYASPTCRSSHDIDIYIGPDRLDALLAQLRQRGITCEEEINDTEKHATFFFEDVHIELHRYAALMDSRRGDRRFQRWWQEGCARPERVAIGGAEVMLAAPTQNLFFIFFHAYHHFCSMDVHFGAFCDVARFLFTHRDSIDREALARELEAQHLVQPWQAFAAFMHSHLGLEAGLIPLFAPEASCRGILKRMRRKCLYPSRPLVERPHGRTRSKLYSLGQHIQAFFDTFGLNPAQALRILWMRLVQGTANFFNKDNRDGTAEHYLERTKGAA